MILTPWGGPRDTTYLELKVRGNLDGTAILSGNWLPPQRLSNTVDLTHRNDHYDTHCVLTYSPEQVRGGQLTFEYRFK